jgi:hypothetical protein
VKIEKPLQENSQGGDTAENDEPHQRPTFLDKI